MKVSGEYDLFSVANNNAIKSFFLFGCLGFVVTLPLSANINALSIVFLLFIRLAALWKVKRFEILEVNISLACILTFLILTIGLYLNGDDLGLLERKLSWLTFPLIFFTKPLLLSSQDLEKILYLFVATILVTCLFSHVKVFYEIVQVNYPFSDWTYRYTGKKLAGQVGMHPTYLSIYLNLASLIILYALSNLRFSVYQAVILLLLSSYFLLYNFLLASRLNLVLHVIILSYFFINFIFRNLKSRTWAVMLVIVWFISLLSITQQISLVQRKIVQTVNFAKNIFFDTAIDIQGYSSSSHYNAWFCSLNELKFPNMIWGKGIVGSKEALLSCYMENEFLFNYEHKFNAHNQIFQTLISEGIIGAVLLLVPFVASLKKKSFLLNFFLVIMLVSFISESVLARQKGLVFYLFFLCLLNLPGFSTCTHGNALKS